MGLLPQKHVPWGPMCRNSRVFTVRSPCRAPPERPGQLHRENTCDLRRPLQKSHAYRPFQSPPPRDAKITCFCGAFSIKKHVFSRTDPPRCLRPQKHGNFPTPGAPRPPRADRKPGLSWHVKTRRFPRGSPPLRENTGFWGRQTPPKTRRFCHARSGMRIARENTPLPHRRGRRTTGKQRNRLGFLPFTAVARTPPRKSDAFSRGKPPPR